MPDQTTAAPANPIEQVAASLLRQVVTMNASEQALDELVHSTAERWAGKDGSESAQTYDTANSMAANVNNGGFAEQITYLLNNGVTETDILDAVSASPEE